MFDEDQQKDVDGLVGVAPKWFMSAVQVNNLTKEETVLVQENENLPVRKFPNVPGKVHVSYGLTRNLGDYNSLRIDVGISLPCLPEDKDATYAEAAAWVESKMRDSRKQVESAKKGSTGL